MKGTTRNNTARCAAVLLAGAILLGGCYRRTVSASGLGAMGTSTESSYRSNTAADRWYDQMFSSKPPTSRTRWVNPGETQSVTQDTADNRIKTQPR